MSWSPAEWSDSVRNLLDAVEPVIPVLVRAVEDSLQAPTPDRIGRASEVLGHVEASFPQIPFEVRVLDAPRHLTARFHVDEAVRTLRYGSDLVGGAERTEADSLAGVERGRYFLRHGLRHYQRARRLMDELPSGPGTP